jgi:hypothetical protein
LSRKPSRIIQKVESAVWVWRKGWVSISELLHPAQANQKCAISAAQNRPIEAVFLRPWSEVEFMQEMPVTQ